MAEIHVEEHSSPIQTPRQLFIVVLLAFAVPITLIVMLTQLVTRGGDLSKDNPAMPSKGGNLALSDADATAAVDYMVGLVK